MGAGQPARELAREDGRGRNSAARRRSPRHRTPRIVLVAEGSPTRVKSLLAQEKKKIARLVGDTPIYDVVVGNGDGQVPLSGLQKFLTKLPRNIDAKRMETIEGRLAALGTRSGPPLPKGPIPGGAKMKGMQRTMKRR